MSPINRHLTRRPSSRQHHLTVFTNLFQSMKKQPTPPDEFCPECMSLKRKPNKECKNHDSYWIKTNEISDAIDSVSVLMVKTIANKHIKVQDTHEGKSHQRHWYLVAQKMLKKLVKEYDKLCKSSYE